ncbi:hypothetical protein D3C76_1541730 [compost metagenome]
MRMLHTATLAARHASRSRLSLPVAARAIKRSSGSWASSALPMRTLLMMAMLAHLSRATTSSGVVCG